MRRLLSLSLLLLLLTAAVAVAQNTAILGNWVDQGATLPANCVVGQIYFKTTATVGLNQCTVANTWAAVGGGGGVTSLSGDGVLITNSGSTGAVTLTLGSIPSTLAAVTQAAGDNSTKVATTAYADLDKIFSITSSLATPSGTQFLPIVGGVSGLLASAGNACSVMPRAGTADKMFVQLSAAEGAAATLAATLAKGGVGQAITCTVGNNGTTCNDTAHSFSFAAGDCLAVQTVQSGTGTSQVISVGTGYH